jgi:hypothetical protein
VAMEFAEDARKLLRRWLGIAAIQRQVRDLETDVAISKEDLDRLNAATSRIAARVGSLLDQIAQLGTGNDDDVRSAQQLADVQAASEDLRPVIEQLEALGADAQQPVPEPTPEQVPVEPGPDVPPVQNGGDDAPVEDAPVEQTPTIPSQVPDASADGGDVPSEPVADDSDNEGF